MTTVWLIIVAWGLVWGLLGVALAWTTFDAWLEEWARREACRKKEEA